MTYEADLIHVEAQDYAALTPRESEILRLVAAGMSAKEIGLKLLIAPRTVDRHIDHLKMKTRAKNRAHMIALAFCDGLLVETVPAGIDA